MTKFFVSDRRTDRRTDGRIKRIEDVERGAELSFFVARPLRGPPLNSSRTNRKVDQILVSDRQTDERTDGRTDGRTDALNV